MKALEKLTPEMKKTLATYKTCIEHHEGLAVEHKQHGWNPSYMIYQRNNYANLVHGYLKGLEDAGVITNLDRNKLFDHYVKYGFNFRINLVVKESKQNDEGI